MRLTRPCAFTVVFLSLPLLVPGPGTTPPNAQEVPLSPLHGVPLVLKDNVDTRGMPTTAGSRFLAGTLHGQEASGGGRHHSHGGEHERVRQRRAHEFGLRAHAGSAGPDANTLGVLRG